MDHQLPFHISLNRLANGYPAHRHDFLEFSYVLEGSGAESVNGIRHPMVPGTFTFVLPDQVHELFTDPGSTLVLYNCNFSMDLLLDSPRTERWFRTLLEDREGLAPFSQIDGIEQEQLLQHIRNMHQEYAGHAHGHEVLLKAMLTELLVRFDRSRRSFPETGIQTAAAAPAAGTAGPIIQYIRINYQNENLMLSDLSARFSISPSRISEVIKEATGQTFVQYLNDVRLRYACGLLLSTTMSIAQIAAEVGFGSYKTFSRVFRERKGAVPSQYRKLKRLP